VDPAPSSDFSVLTVRTPGDSVDDIRVFRKPWEHALTFARAHQVEPAMVPAGLVLVAAAASYPLLVTRVTFPSHSVFFSISVSAVSVALYPDSPLFARSQPPHLGSSVGDFMRSSVPERRCLSPRSNSVPGILDATVNINPPAPYSHGRPQQLGRVRLQGVIHFAYF
jgi:hypothetical protein